MWLIVHVCYQLQVIKGGVSIADPAFVSVNSVMEVPDCHWLMVHIHKKLTAYTMITRATMIVYNTWNTKHMNSGLLSVNSIPLTFRSTFWL